MKPCEIILSLDSLDQISQIVGNQKNEKQFLLQARIEGFKSIAFQEENVLRIDFGNGYMLLDLNLNPTQK